MSPAGGATAPVPDDVQHGPMRWQQERRRPMPVQVSGEVLSLRRVGAYHAMTVVAPGIAEVAKPGQFVAVAVGGPDTAHVAAPRVLDPPGPRARRLRRHRRVRLRGRRAAAPPGSPSRRPHDPIDIVGPLGRPFALPREPATCVLVGGGYGTAPLFPLADALRARGCRVDFVLGAATEDRLFGALDAKRIAATLTRHHRRRLGGRARPGVRRAARGARRRARPTSSTPAGRWRCCRRSADDRRRRPASRARSPSRSRWPAAIGVCMTCVLPVDRRRRHDPDGALVRRRSGVPRRPGAVRRRRHRSAPTRSARRGLATPETCVDAAVEPRRQAQRADGRRDDAMTTHVGRAPPKSRRVDMSDRRWPVRSCPNPVFTASGCAAAGQELAAVLRRRRSSAAS